MRSLGRFLSLITLTAWIGHLGAQGLGTAGISGTLADESGAALASANVEAVNTATAVSRSTVTDSQGHYSFADLPIGSYDIRASSPNLENVVRSGVTLTVGSDLIVDFVLKVRKTQDSVVVRAEVSRVETQSAAISSLVSEEQVHSLPLNGRNFEQLISLAPGVSAVPASLAQFTNTTPTNPIYGNQDNYSVSGSRPVGAAFLLDSTDISDFYNHATGSDVSGSSLGVDAIAEFQVLTNTYSAQFGGTGAAINIVSRSGTNQWHGSVYEFLRNNDLDSRGYFDVAPDGKPASAPPYRRNQFGGSSGGPLRKDRLFYFINYEGLRSSLGQTQIAYVPEPYVLRGQLCTINPQNASPGSTTCPSGDLTQVVPSVSPIQAAILGLYPKPSRSAPDLGSYSPYPESASLLTDENYFFGRVDYSISSTDSIFARYVAYRVNQTNPFAGSAIPLWPEVEVTRNQYLTVQEHHVLAPSAINLVRASWVTTHSDGHTTADLPALALFPDPQRQNMDVTPGGGLSTVGPNGTGPFLVAQDKATIGDDLLWSWGAHRITAGFSVSRVQSALGDGDYQGGSFTFFQLSHFLLGSADLYYGSPPPTSDYDLTRGFRQIDFFPYVEDDWKIARKLTLNLGLRWDFATNAVGSGTPLEAILNPATDTGYTRTQHVLASNPNWENLDPRIGLAYDPFPDHKTSIRAGFGIFHEQVEARTYALGYDTAPPSPFVLDGSGGIPFPMIPAQPFDQFNGLSYGRTNHAPYVMQYNLTLQREVFANTVISLGYIGSHGVHLFSLVSENLPLPCSAVSSPLPSWCPALPSGPPGSLGNPFTGILSNPSFGYLEDDAPTSTSRYNSLQVSLSRQLGHGLQAQASYTWSKCIDDGSASTANEGSYGVVDPYDQALDRGACAFNRNQSAVANVVYSLPFQRNRLVSGWQFSGIWTASSGLPVNVVDGYDASLASEAPARPNYSGATGCHPYEILNQPIAGPAIQYFNPACYSVQSIGTEGNVPRDSLYGPGLINLDFAVTKRTRITEKLSAELRSEFFNILNRSNFGQPNPNIFIGPTAGQITSLATSPRQIQFAVRLLF